MLVVAPLTDLCFFYSLHHSKPFLRHSEADIEKVFAVNVYSQLWTLQEFLPHFMEEKKGHVVSMSSTAGLVGTPNLTAYWYAEFPSIFLGVN